MEKIATLEKELEQARAENNDLSEKVIGFKSAYEEWCAKAQRLSERNAELEKEIASLEFQLKLAKETKVVL
jgi:uncharacterized coiled-coil DUF342 family protein